MSEPANENAAKVKAWYTQEQAAEYIGCELHAFKLHVKAGRIVRRGDGLRSGRYRHDEVQALKVRLDRTPTAPKHLYVVEFVGRFVKIGITGNPARRISRHLGDAGRFGLQVGRVWVSLPHPEAVQNELLLKRGHRTEYLRRKYDAVIAEILEMPFTRVAVANG